MSELRASSAVREVTPEVGTAVPLRGYTAPGDRIATRVRDPLSARALAVSGGDRTIGIVSVDAIAVPDDVRRRVRAALVESGPGLDGLVLAATHTHAGPFVPMGPIDSLKDFDTAEHADAIDAAVERIERGIVDAVRGAVEGLEPADVRIGRAENDRTAVNRRREWGAEIAGTRADSGGLDPELVAAEFETRSGDRTVLFNYACHPVCSTRFQTAVSADWPGRVYERLRDERGATALFLNGAAGDVNPRDRYPETTEDDAVYEYMTAIGDEIADTVLAALADAEQSSTDSGGPRVAARRRELSLPVKSPPPRDAIERQLDQLETRRDRLEDAGLEESPLDRQARWHLEAWLALADWDRDRLSASMTHVECGDLGLLTVPAEPLTAHGLAFKREAEGTLAVAGYANGNLGYLPPLSELENGGYEVRMCPLAPEGIQRIRDCGVGLVPSLREQ
jgi:hypothetical protein